MESKVTFKRIVADMEKFKSFGTEWADADNKSSVAKSRSYAKRLMKDLKSFISLSMADEKLVKPKPVIVEEASEVEEEIIEEEVEEVEEEEVKEDTGFTSWFDKKD
jgi:hypothetical protein